MSLFGIPYPTYRKKIRSQSETRTGLIRKGNGQDILSRIKIVEKILPIKNLIRTCVEGYNYD